MRLVPSGRAAGRRADEGHRAGPGHCQENCGPARWDTHGGERGRCGDDVYRADRGLHGADDMMCVVVRVEG